MQAAGVLAGMFSIFGPSKGDSDLLEIENFMAEPVTSLEKLKDHKTSMQARMELLIMKIQVWYRSDETSLCLSIHSSEPILIHVYDYCSSCRLTSAELWNPRKVTNPSSLLIVGLERKEEAAYPAFLRKVRSLKRRG